jgi:hypothetical protein
MTLSSEYSLMAFLLGAGAALLAAQLLLTVFLMKALRRIPPLEDRLGQLSSALSLLTETSEAGFGAVAAEVERLNLRPPRRTEGATTTTRVVKAARRGESIEEIAAAEHVSESEVRLRLHFAECPAASREDSPPWKAPATADAAGNRAGDTVTLSLPPQQGAHGEGGARVPTPTAGTPRKRSRRLPAAPTAAGVVHDEAPRSRRRTRKGVPLAAAAAPTKPSLPSDPK